MAQLYNVADVTMWAAYVSADIESLVHTIVTELKPLLATERPVLASTNVP